MPTSLVWGDTQERWQRGPQTVSGTLWMLNKHLKPSAKAEEGLGVWRRCGFIGEMLSSLIPGSPIPHSLTSLGRGP